MVDLAGYRETFSARQEGVRLEEVMKKLIEHFKAFS